MAAHTSSVTLRQRLMKSGNTRLYLDIYVQGKRSVESTGLYLVEGKSREIKERNKETLMRAQAIAKKREEEILNQTSGVGNKQPKDELFFEYFKECQMRHKDTTSQSWQNALNYLVQYEPNSRKLLSRIDREWVIGFRDFLMNDAISSKFNRKLADADHPQGIKEKIKPNTANTIFCKLVACLTCAVEDQLIPASPAMGVKNIPTEEAERTFLSKEELKSLSATPCESEEAKRAFLFSCMTGLRYSDVRALTWGKVSKNGDYTRVAYRQIKTGKLEYLDVNASASALIGVRPDGSSNEDPVFNMPSNPTINKHVKKWMRDAGIDKYITFHSSRHTFATILLDSDVDIYTTSKLLGHRKLQTTEIYAHIVDKKKQDAVTALDNLI